MKQPALALLLLAFLPTLLVADILDYEDIPAYEYRSLEFQPLYIDFGSNLGMVPRVKQREISVCLTGTSPANDKKFKDWITVSLKRWIEPLRAITEAPLTETFVFKTAGCDLRFRVVAGTWGYTSNIGLNPVVTVGPNVPFGVVIHEFGHVFGLSDTYQNGRSGDCKPGQPQSLMCNISFSEPQDDDIRGIRAVYRKKYPLDRPPVGSPLAE